LEIDKDLGGIQPRNLGIAHLVKILLRNSPPHNRLAAICALLYLFDDNDVINDFDEQGFIDDDVVLAITIDSIAQEEEVSTELKEWALRTLASIDEVLPEHIQNNIQAKMVSIREGLSHLMSTDAARKCPQNNTSAED
jgi:uncharacterized membrane protein YkvA (DUF1232 family)